MDDELLLRTAIAAKKSGAGVAAVLRVLAHSEPSLIPILRDLSDSLRELDDVLDRVYDKRVRRP